MASDKQGAEKIIRLRRKVDYTFLIIMEYTVNVSLSQTVWAKTVIGPLQVGEKHNTEVGWMKGRASVIGLPCCSSITVESLPN